MLRIICFTISCLLNIPNVLSNPNDIVILKIDPCVGMLWQSESKCCENVIVNDSNTPDLVARLRRSRIPSAIAFSESLCRYVVVNANGNVTVYDSVCNSSDYIFCCPRKANPSKCYLVCCE